MTTAWQQPIFKQKKKPLITQGFLQDSIISLRLLIKSFSYYYTLVLFRIK